MTDQQNESRSNLLLLTTARLFVLPLNAVALYLLLRGHNLPGGGFIAGLVMALSILLVGLAQGLGRVELMLKFDPLRSAVVGLLIAALSAVAPMFVGYPLLTHVQGYVTVPYLGKVAWGTPLLFDIGVMLLVAGVSIKIMVVLARSMSGEPPLLHDQASTYAASVEESIELRIDEKLKASPSDASADEKTTEGPDGT